MKKIIYSLFFISASAFANVHGCSIKDTLFFSYTIDHKKAVELCKMDGGYRFAFGVVGRPEIVLYRSRANIYRLQQGGGVFRVINGTHSFTIVEGDGKNNNSEMIVMEKSTFLLRIHLDDNSDEYINKTFGWVI